MLQTWRNTGVWRKKNLPNFELLGPKPFLYFAARIWSMTSAKCTVPVPHFNKFHWCLAAEAQMRSAKRMTCTCARGWKGILVMLITEDKPDWLAPLSSYQHQLDEFAKTITFPRCRPQITRDTKTPHTRNKRDIDDVNAHGSWLWKTYGRLSVFRDFKSKLLDFLLGSPSVAWAKIWRSQEVSKPGPIRAMKAMSLSLHSGQVVKWSWHALLSTEEPTRAWPAVDGASVFTKLRQLSTVSQITNKCVKKKEPCRF